MTEHKYLLKFFVSLLAVCMVSGADAVVAQRRAVARTSTSVTPTATAQGGTTATTTKTTEAPVPQQEFKFEDQTAVFSAAMGDVDGVAVRSNDADKEGVFAEMIRQQRNALDASQAMELSTNAARAAYVAGKNACDIELRRCMQSKCGNDFAKCAGDTDTSWGDKMDACRRDTECTGAEYAAFAPEIRADRDAKAELANFNAIVDCGNRYNSCVIGECGATFSKCLGKSAGDAAIAKCKKVQTECAKMDSGLAARMMDVFAGVRQDAEKQVQRDEARLYAMRDEMATTCKRAGAMFDERSLDCVYTINFFADAATTPYASKKAYAGSVFNCEPGWFGIDITTFKENAYRLTRAQTSASSAMLGSGLGVAAGAITSGAIDRALETQNAKKELQAAKAYVDEHYSGRGDGQATSGGGGITPPAKPQPKADNQTVTETTPQAQGNDPTVTTQSQSRSNQIVQQFESILSDSMKATVAEIQQNIRETGTVTGNKK